MGWPSLQQKVGDRKYGRSGRLMRQSFTQSNLFSDQSIAYKDTSLIKQAFCGYVKSNNELAKTSGLHIKHLDETAAL